MKRLFLLLAFTIVLLFASSASESCSDWRTHDVPVHREVARLECSPVDETEYDAVIRSLEAAEYIILAQTADGYEIVVRALYNYLGGAFSVYENDDGSISVFYDALGSEYEPPHKTAVKVRVRKFPTAVYVFCSIVS